MKRFCTVKNCKGIILRGNTYCQAHVARLKKFGDLQIDKPIKYLQHRFSKTSTYYSWAVMKNRCLNINAADFKHYGGRGITLCKDWHDFRNFLKDMGEKPHRCLTLERVNNSKGYSKKNCIWASRYSQGQNRRTNKVTFFMAEKIREDFLAGDWQKDLSDEYGLHMQTIALITSNKIWI